MSDSYLQPGESPYPVPNVVSPLKTQESPPPNWRGNGDTQYYGKHTGCVSAMYTTANPRILPAAGRGNGGASHFGFARARSPE